MKSRIIRYYNQPMTYRDGVSNIYDLVSRLEQRQLTLIITSKAIPPSPHCHALILKPNQLGSLPETLQHERAQRLSAAGKNRSPFGTELARPLQRLPTRPGPAGVGGRRRRDAQQQRSRLGHPRALLRPRRRRPAATRTQLGRHVHKSHSSRGNPGLSTQHEYACRSNAHSLDQMPKRSWRVPEPIAPSRSRRRSPETLRPSLETETNFSFASACLRSGIAAFSPLICADYDNGNCSKRVRKRDGRIMMMVYWTCLRCEAFSSSSLLSS